MSFKVTTTTEIYTLSLHDALPILEELALLNEQQGLAVELQYEYTPVGKAPMVDTTIYRLVQESLTNVRIHAHRSEEHTSELQSHVNLVCRLLLEKKKRLEERLARE